MLLTFSLEASHPRGTCYRLAIGCTLHPVLASMVAAFTRLF